MNSTVPGLPATLRAALALSVLLFWVAWLFTLAPRPSMWLVIATGLPSVAVISWSLSSGERWPVFARRTWDWHALGLVLLIALGVQCEDAHGITTDGVIYFSQLRSAIFDRDLDVAAEFAFLGQGARPSHVVPMGPTIVWLPLYMVVAGVDLIGQTLGRWTAPAGAGAGLTLPYVRAALVSSFAIGAFGLIVLHGWLRREFGAASAFAATLLVLGATPLFWYMVYEPSMSHAVSFGFVALFVVLSARWTTPSISRRQALILGASLGLAFITRPQEAVFALFPAALLVAADASRQVRMTTALRLAWWGFVGALPFLVVQVAHFALLVSREHFDLVGGGDSYLHLTASRWMDTLWSSWHGFFSWTPIAYVAAIGTAFYVRRHRGWVLGALVTVFAMAWINGSTADWPGGWSFGGRRFTSTLVVLAPGIALIVQTLMRRPMAALSVMAIVAIGWNYLIMRQFASGMLTPGRPVSFAQMIEQQAVLATDPPFVYPFAFPANVLFAWRTGLPIESYDLLGSEPLRARIDLQLNSRAASVLLGDWGMWGGDQFGDLRWTAGDRVEVLLPLDAPRNRQIELTWWARTRRLDPPQTATFALLINGREMFRFTPDTDQSTTWRVTTEAGDGVWIKGFNRVAFERRGGTAPIGIYRVSVE